MLDREVEGEGVSRGQNSHCQTPSVHHWSPCSGQLLSLVEVMDCETGKRPVFNSVPADLKKTRQQYKEQEQKPLNSEVIAADSVAAGRTVALCGFSLDKKTKLNTKETTTVGDFSSKFCLH